MEDNVQYICQRGRSLYAEYPNPMTASRTPTLVPLVHFVLLSPGTDFQLQNAQMIYVEDIFFVDTEINHHIFGNKRVVTRFGAIYFL